MLVLVHFDPDHDISHFGLEVDSPVVGGTRFVPLRQNKPPIVGEYTREPVIQELFTVQLFDGEMRSLTQFIFGEELHIAAGAIVFILARLGLNTPCPVRVPPNTEMLGLGTAEAAPRPL